jgi:hypothetical protein
MREPPKKGSLRESLLILYVLQKERVEHEQFRALVQTIINKEKGPEVFQECTQIRFPWLEKQKSRDKAEHLRLLLDEIKKGGLSIRPLAEAKPMRSRLKTPPRPPALPSSAARDDRLYKKLGMIVPVK